MVAYTNQSSIQIFMKKLKQYVSSSVSLSVASALAFSLSTHANGQESRLKNEVTQVELSKLAELKKVAGFAQYLKQDSDLFFNLSRTKNIVQYLRNSQLGIHFAEFAKSEGDYDINI